MRRGFSIFLILMFGLGPLSVLIDGSEDANLPACCRRHGAHHCAIAAQMAAMAGPGQTGKATTVSAPMTCPRYPGTLAMLSTPTQALVAPSRTSEELLALEFVLVARQASPHSKLVQAHAGRGPPESSRC